MEGQYGADKMPSQESKHPVPSVQRHSAIQQRELEECHHIYPGFFAVAGGSHFCTGNHNVVELMNELMRSMKGANSFGRRRARRGKEAAAPRAHVCSRRGGSTEAQVGRAPGAGAQGRRRGRALGQRGSRLRLGLDDLMTLACWIFV